MMHFACTWVGPWNQNVRGYNPEYVARLYRGIARNMPELGWDFTCFVDEHTLHAAVNIPDEMPRYAVVRDNLLEGLSPQEKNWWWWAKLNAFREDVWPKGEKVIHIDLDSVIVDDLSPLVNLDRGWSGLHMLNWEGPWYPWGSGVMDFPAGTLPQLAHFNETFPAKYPKGDQQRIAEMISNKKGYPKKLITSYKKDVREGELRKECIVAYHGSPRPEEALKKGCKFTKAYWI